MNDYKLKFIELDPSNSIPQCGLGTYGLTSDDLKSLFDKYPYDRLLIDTAFRYGNEKAVYQAFSKNIDLQNRCQIIGKICYAQQLEYSVQDALIMTLTNLGLDKIDFYLIHSPRYSNFVETWKQMISLRDQGLIKYIGVSNFNVEHIKSLVQNTGVLPKLNQIPYESDDFYNIIDYCKKNRIIVQIVMLFGGLEKRHNISFVEREKRIKFILENDFSCVIGTKNITHMLENFAYFIK